MKHVVTSCVLFLVSTLAGAGCASSKGASALTIQPSSARIAPGQMVPFQATFNDQRLSNATWSLAEGDAGGTLTAQGLYTAPGSSGTYHVSAKYSGSQASVAVTVTTGAIAPTADSGTIVSTADSGTIVSTADSGTVVTIDAGAGSGLHVARDPNGWTIVTPSADSRLIYVSSKSGNDSTGAFLLGKDIPSGQTAQTQIPPSPFKTIAKAKALMRPGYPDWLLLKAGEIWSEEIGSVSGAGGRSADEPMLFSGYASSATAARPQIRPNPAGAGDSTVYHNGSTVTSHVYFIGLEFYDVNRDPSAPEFVHDSSGKAAGHDNSAVSWLDGGDDILFEDCFVHFMGGGISVQLAGGPAPKNLTVRRCVLTDMYGIDGHSQAIYLYTVDGVLVEENIFDHNSWNDQALVPADVFNHHMYTFNLTNTVIRNNMFLRDGSLHMKLMSEGINKVKNVAISNNLFFEGEVGISANFQKNDGDPVPSGGSCINGLSIANNILLQINRDNPTGRGLGWGIDLSTVTNATLSGNIFSDFSFTGNTFAIYLESTDQTTSVSSNVTIQNNLLYKVNVQGIALQPQSGWSNILIGSNTIQDGGLGAAMQSQSGPFAPLTYSGNIYSASKSSNFALINNAQQTYAQWVAASGETASAVQTVTYPSPGLNLDTYMAKFSLKLTDLYTAVRGQSKATWSNLYTATVINDYVRGGFGLPPLGLNR